MSCFYVKIVANGGQHASKKLKTMKQGIYIKQEPSQVPSQMSNMAPANKIIKIITNKDRGRKVKALKVLSSLYITVIFLSFYLRIHYMVTVDETLSFIMEGRFDWLCFHLFFFIYPTLLESCKNKVSFDMLGSPFATSSRETCYS